MVYSVYYILNAPNFINALINLCGYSIHSWQSWFKECQMLHNIYATFVISTTFQSCDYPPCWLSPSNPLKHNESIGTGRYIPKHCIPYSLSDLNVLAAWICWVKVKSEQKSNVCHLFGFKYKKRICSDGLMLILDT